MRCIRCNSIVQEGMQFCPNCGVPLTSHNNVNREYLNDYHNTNIMCHEEWQTSKRSSNRGLILGVLIAVIGMGLILFILLILLIMSSITERSNSEDEVAVIQEIEQKNVDNKQMNNHLDDAKKERKIVLAQDNNQVVQREEQFVDNETNQTLDMVTEDYNSQTLRPNQNILQEMGMTREELNKYLSYYWFLSDYSSDSPDYQVLMDYVFFYLYYFYSGDEVIYTDNTICPKHVVDSILYQYFNTVGPDRTIGSYEYYAGNYYMPSQAWGDDVMEISLFDEVKRDINGDYLITFCNFFVYYEDLEFVNNTTEEEYFSYEISRMKDDRFSDLREYGECRVRKMDNRWIMLKYSTKR